MQASVYEAKTNPSKFLDAVAKGERLVIPKYGVPAAELVPARKGKVRFGSLAGLVSPPPDDFTP